MNDRLSDIDLLVFVAFHNEIPVFGPLNGNGRALPAADVVKNAIRADTT
ncbi:MAG: hypothetical protein P8K80_05550 [Phycisphaerales bacterium]|nr:hypothetical protein [Phycisphaerales bacterium]